VIATPRIAGNKVLIKTESGDLQALDSANGQVRWTFHQNPPELMLRGGSSPVVAGSHVLAGFSDGQLVSLNLNDGRLQWSRQIALPHGASAVERLVDIRSEPVVRDGVVYVVTYQGKLAALSLGSGNAIWEHDMSSHVGLAVDASAVYAVDDNSHVWALDRQTGRVRWHQDKLEGRGLTQPVVTPGSLVMGDSEGYVHWVSLQNGRFLGRHSVDSKRLLATPQLYQGHVVVLSSSGKLVSLLAR
jgi:outer membrane protein assembly factor BamB